MKLLHDGKDNGMIVVRHTDGTVLILTDEYLRMKHIPGRKRSEVKTMEWYDLIVFNDALKLIFPDYQRPSEGIPDDVKVHFEG